MSASTKPLSPDPAATGRGRVDAVWAAAEAAGAGRPRPYPVVIATRHGEVRIRGMERRSDGKIDWIEVWLDGDTAGGDPHFRIFNPPTLAKDPAGPVLVRGERYRVDPLAAIAEAVAANGGAVRRRTR